MKPKVLFAALALAEVDYVLIGGLAAALQGGTRITADIDLAYATHDANLHRLCDVLNTYAPRRLMLGDVARRTYRAA